MEKPRVEKKIFLTGFVVILLTTMLLVTIPNAQANVNAIFNFITSSFDWAFEVVIFGVFILLIWLALGPYGRVKLGAEDEVPEFSTFSWVAMLFNAGIGSSLFYWAMVEPIYYLNGPPFGIAPNSPQAAEWALAYGMFHWGLSAWGTYALPALAIAYTFYVKKVYVLRPSVTCVPILGKYVEGWGGRIIDVMIMFSIVGGVGTALGVNVPMVSALIANIFGIADSDPLRMGVLILWTFLFGGSAYLGVNAGIKKLSDINSYVAIAFLGFVLFAGPTTFILSYFSNSFGVMLDGFFKMSFYTDPILKSGFPQSWTVFYWAWWLAFAVYIGMFFARISRGRTIRELIFGVVVFGSLGCFIFFAVFGGYAVYLDINGTLPLAKSLNTQDASGIIVMILGTLPFAQIVIPVFVLVSLISQATGLDAAAYTLASICTERTHVEVEPSRWNRLFWAIVLGGVALALIVVKGLKVVQLSSVLVGVPIILLYIVFVLSLLQGLKEDYGD